MVSRWVSDNFQAIFECEPTTYSKTICARSSTGQSNGLRNHRLQVRVLPGVINLTRYHAVPIAGNAVKVYRERRHDLRFTTRCR